MITEFRGDYAFLSSFFQAPIQIPLWGEMVTIPDVEHGFQAWKATRREDAFYVAEAPTAKEARSRGRHIDCIPNWDAVKREAMLTLQIKKYRQHPSLKNLLAGTGDQVLVEGNRWHDNYWGSCSCEQCVRKHVGDVTDVLGQNYLGKILMATRMILC